VTCQRCYLQFGPPPKRTATKMRMSPRRKLLMLSLIRKRSWIVAQDGLSLEICPKGMIPIIAAIYAPKSTDQLAWPTSRNLSRKVVSRLTIRDGGHRPTGTEPCDRLACKRARRSYLAPLMVPHVNSSDSMFADRSALSVGCSLPEVNRSERPRNPRSTKATTFALAPTRTLRMRLSQRA
jgi:hypothetical protein